MWPLNVSQLVGACGARPLRGGVLDEELAKRAIYRAIAWSGLPLGPSDSFFALDVALHALVPDALEKGALCIVKDDWGGLADLDPTSLARCFVVDGDNVPVLVAYRRLAAFLRSRFTFPVIAVGGSNGKTTTKDMIHHVLGGRHVTATPGTNNGWVGVPITLCHPGHKASSASSSASPTSCIACVLEIGIDEKGAMREHIKIAKPNIAVLTALGPEHLAGLGTHDDAIREELELFAGADTKRVWLAEEPALASRIAKEARTDDLVVERASCSRSATANVLTYEWHAASPAQGSLTLTWRGETVSSPLPVPGEHNGRNAALAVGAALLAMHPSQTLEEIASRLATFRAPEQRCVVRELASGCVLIDDSYNASPSSVVAALDVFDGIFDRDVNRVLVLGDMLDLGEESARWHAGLVPRILESLKRHPSRVHVRLFGEHMSAIAPLLDRAAASIGRMSPRSNHDQHDPATLIDDLLRDLDSCVVLVKGSRGMELERVTAHIASRESVAWSEEHSIGVGIVGEGAEAFATSLRAVLAASSSSSSSSHLSKRVFVRSLDQTALEGGATLRHPHHIAILTRLAFTEGDGADPERELAAMAQLFVHAKKIAILPHAAFLNEEEGDDEALQLLADVVPPNITTLRHSQRQNQDTNVMVSDLIAVASEAIRVLLCRPDAR